MPNSDHTDRLGYSPMKAPFETLALPQAEAEDYLAGFDRPGHVALVVGPWFHSEFDEFVDDFEDPHALIQNARDLDLRDWIETQTRDQAVFGDQMGGLFEAMMGSPTAAPHDGANDAEKYVHAARKAFDAEETPPQFIKDLEDTLEDAARMMNATGGADPMPDVLNIVNRLQKIQDQADGLEDSLRTIQTIGQFFMGEQVAKATGASDAFEAMVDPDAGSPEAPDGKARLFHIDDPVADTIVAILPVDDPWAALAWMQHGSYAHQAVPLLAVARDLARRFGAVPVVATSDSIGFKLKRPAKGAGDEIVEAFQALGATTLNDIETQAAAAHLREATEWQVWWD